MSLSGGSKSLSSFSLSGSFPSFVFFPVAAFFLFPGEAAFEGDFFTPGDSAGDDSVAFFPFLGGDLDF